MTDDDGRLLGIVTHDDAADILEEEAEEDIEMMAGIAHERGLRVHIDGARIFNAAAALDADLVVNIQGDEPLAKEQMLALPQVERVCSRHDLVERVLRPDTLFLEDAS